MSSDLSDFPEPNILYRIQSTDFETCLELWDVEEEAVVLRTLKDTDLQQWLLIKDGDAYKIMAAATQSSLYPVYLTIAVAGTDSQLEPRPLAGATAGFDVNSKSHWRIRSESDGSYVQADHSRKKTLVTKSSSGLARLGRLILWRRKISNRRSFNRSMRWQIVEYWPPMPKDTYRIRTLNGSALDLDPNFTQLSVAAVRKDDRQEWNVVSKGNGKCSISNGDGKTYLAWEKSKDGIAQVATSKAPVEWFIKSLGEYTYSITFDFIVDARTTLKLALSVTDEEVLLKPRKVAQNQIWFFESIVTLSSSDNPPPYSSTARYPEITERAYALRNLAGGSTPYFAGFDNPSRFVPHEAQYLDTDLKYVDSGNSFKLSYKDHFTRIWGDAVEATTGAADATHWVLERENDPAGGYVYYICLAANRNRVLSGKTVTGAGGGLVYKVTSKKYGAPIQQWKIET